MNSARRDYFSNLYNRWEQLEPETVVSYNQFIANNMYPV